VCFAYMRTLTFPGQTKEGIVLRLNEELKERGFDIVSRVDIQVCVQRLDLVCGLVVPVKTWLAELMITR
jgi:hypothetical protein